MAGVRLVEDVVSISGVQIVHRVDAILVPGARGISGRWWCLPEPTPRRGRYWWLPVQARSGRGPVFPIGGTGAQERSMVLRQGGHRVRALDAWQSSAGRERCRPELRGLGREVLVTALEELRAGLIGEEVVSLLGRTIRAVAVARNFPPPDDLGNWGEEAVARTVSEFVADSQTPRRVLDLATACATDQALAARLQGTVRNFLADLGRRTPLGKLVVRINEVLGRHEEFVRTHGRWSLADGAGEPGSADVDRLAKVIGSHRVSAPRWGHEARRAAPVADSDTIVALCKAMLGAAGGSLTPRTMAAAIGMRLGIGQAPVSLDAASLDPGALDGYPARDSTADAALRESRAAEILVVLNDRERVALAWPEYTVRELAPVLGVGPSQAHIIRRRAIEMLREELADDPDGEAVAGRVLALSRRWAEQWTGREVPA